MIKTRFNLRILTVTSGFLGIFLLIPLQATAVTFSKIYAFGDSLSDTGNVNQIVQTATGGTASFPPFPYYNGRFSNGPIWVEKLADKLGISLVNFSYGGATTGTANTLDTTFNSLGLPSSLLPGLQGEITAFQNQYQNGADPDALYTIWAGANDFLPTNSTFQAVNTPTTSLSNITIAVNSLANLGAKNFMVLNLPNLGELPLTRGSINTQVCALDASCLNSLTASYNGQLLSSFSTNLNVISIDVNTLVSNAIAEKEQFGIKFTNVTNACLNTVALTVCNNPNDYLFWDSTHPTTQGHELIAKAAFQSTAVPEPNLSFGAIVALGFGVFLRRKFAAIQKTK